MNNNDYGDYIYGRAALRLQEPWIVPEALGFLKAMFSVNGKPDFDVFEWGAGGSTLWFGKHTSGLVHVVEQNAKWISWLAERKTHNVMVHHKPKRAGLSECAEAYTGYADCIFKILPTPTIAHNIQFISVDGERRVRTRCIKNALDILNAGTEGGVIMLDNSNWPDVAEGVALLEQYEHYDFDAPKNSHIPDGWRTSFYIIPGVDDD